MIRGVDDPIQLSNQLIPANSAVRPSLRVEVSTFAALVIHLTSEQISQDGTQHKNPAQHKDSQYNIPKAVH